MLQKYHALSRLGPSTFNDAPLKNEPTEIGKIKNTALCSQDAAVCRTGPHRGVANVAHWNKSRGSSLILAKDRLKQPFEFLSERFAASNARTITALRSLGVLEDGMEHHAQALLALSISSALCLAAWIWARRRLTRLSGKRAPWLRLKS